MGGGGSTAHTYDGAATSSKHYDASGGAVGGETSRDKSPVELLMSGGDSLNMYKSHGGGGNGAMFASGADIYHRALHHDVDPHIELSPKLQQQMHNNSNNNNGNVPDSYRASQRVGMCGELDLRKY